jgi:hypothetical protein
MQHSHFDPLPPTEVGQGDPRIIGNRRSQFRDIGEAQSQKQNRRICASERKRAPVYGIYMDGACIPSGFYMSIPLMLQQLRAA